MSSIRIPQKLGRKTGSDVSRFSRVDVVFVGFVVIGLVLLVRLYRTQVAEHAAWEQQAAEQRLATVDVKAERGEIFLHDADGVYPLAVNREYMLAYVSPQDVTEPEKVTLALSQALGVDPQEIVTKLARRHDPFEIIKRRLSDEEVNRVKALEDQGLQGVALLPEKYRYYPAGTLAAHVVGFSGLGEAGSTRGYGIEASFDDELRGFSEKIREERDAGGRWIALSGMQGSKPNHGDALVLTIDRVMQHETEKILRDAVEKHGADSATAIVMEPETGKILAMATEPDFNPNEYAKAEDYSVFLNPAVSLPYEPGSIMKPVTMAIGIDEKKVSASTEYTDTGAVTESGYTVRNSEDKVYGRSSMTRVLEQSINTGMIFVERQVGHQVFAERLRRFGFGEKTGVKLPAEAGGNLHNLDDARIGIQFYTASFGQGITATPLQMVTAYAALANGGILMKPQIVERIEHADGTQKTIPSEEIRRVISKETSVAIGKMLRSVVVNGHGKRADVSGYEVVGKTGTAQVAKTDGKGYEEGKTIGSFAGYAPRENPRFVILMKIVNPKDVQWAESTAAPAFGQLMRFLLEYARIEPTEGVKS